MYENNRSAPRFWMLDVLLLLSMATPTLDDDAITEDVVVERQLFDIDVWLLFWLLLLAVLFGTTNVVSDMLLVVVKLFE